MAPPDPIYDVVALGEESPRLFAICGWNEAVVIYDGEPVSRLLLNRSAGDDRGFYEFFAISTLDARVPWLLVLESEVIGLSERGAVAWWITKYWDERASVLGGKLILDGEDMDGGDTKREFDVAWGRPPRVKR